MIKKANFLFFYAIIPYRSLEVTTMLQTKEFFISLASCITEAQVKRILDTNVYTQDKANWIPLGKNQNNAAMVQNTAGSLGSCMTELATNAIDAIIQREKNKFDEKGIIIPEHNLVSPEAFLKFALQDTYTDIKKREKFAEKNVKFLTTESTEGKRMLTVIDHGCGQKAENFGDTFCSVGSGQTNKANKNWLHGNYGQGSTSANAISGKYGYKIVVSRENERDNWGFTVIRRSPTDPSMLEYLIYGDSVLEFSSNKIELGLRVTGKFAPGEASLAYGSAIKLFDVKFDKGFTGIKRTMGIVLFRPAFPIKSIEFSSANEKGKKPNGRDSRWLHGQGYEFDKMHNIKKAEKRDFYIEVPELGTARGSMYFIRKNEHVKEILEWFPNNYLEKTKRVFHINNGQVQHTDQSSKIGQFFPKAQDHVFVELDLSFFDKRLAKAYLWKADRTACQTSNEYFQNYDQIINKFFENNDTLKEWALQCKEDEMANLKSSSSTKIDDSTKTAFALMNTRESQKYKANKQLIQNENTGVYSSGRFSIVADTPEENLEKTEIVGKEIPTILSSAHNSKTTAKKTSIKKLSTSLKTDILKGSVSSKQSNTNVKVTSASIQSNGIEKQLDASKFSLFVSEGNGSINFEVSPNNEIKEKLKVGDTLVLKVSLNTEKDGQTYILEENIFFDIIEQLKDVSSPKMRPSTLKDIFTKQYGTRDGRLYNKATTATLIEKENEFSFHAGYFVYNNDGEIIVTINLDNPEFQLQLSTYKNEDRVNFMKHWEVSLLLKVITKYNFWHKMGKTNLEELAKSLNNTEEAAWLNEDCIRAADYQIKEADNLITKTTQNRKMAV